MKRAMYALLAVAMALVLSSCDIIGIGGGSKTDYDESNAINLTVNEKGDHNYWLPTHMETFNPDGSPLYTYDITYADETYVLDTMNIKVYDENGKVSKEQKTKLASYEEKDYITFWTYETEYTVDGVKQEPIVKKWFMLDNSIYKNESLFKYQVAWGTDEISFDEAKEQLTEKHLGTEWFLVGSGPVYQCYTLAGSGNNFFALVSPFPADEIDANSLRVKPDTDFLEWTGKTASGESFDTIITSGFTAGLVPCDVTKDEVSAEYYYVDGTVAEKDTFIAVTHKAYLQYFMLDIDSVKTLAITAMTYLADGKALHETFLEGFDSGKYQEPCSYRDHYINLASENNNSVTEDTDVLKPL